MKFQVHNRSHFVFQHNDSGFHDESASKLKLKAIWEFQLNPSGEVCMSAPIATFLQIKSLQNRSKGFLRARFLQTFCEISVASVIVRGASFRGAINFLLPLRTIPISIWGKWLSLFQARLLPTMLIANINSCLQFANQEKVFRLILSQI